MATRGWLVGESISEVWSQELFPTAVPATGQGVVIVVLQALTAGSALVTPALAGASLVWWGSTSEDDGAPVEPWRSW